jgi:hypothetical protein
MPETNEVVIEQPIIVEYQHTDENGQPLLKDGKPIITNFTGKTEREIIDKLKEAHINVTRALNRTQKLKAVAKQPDPPAPQFTPEQEAARKMAGTDEIQKELDKVKKSEYAADARTAALAFCESHEDYFRCKANSDLITQYITQNELDPRIVDNYEIAFSAVEGKLAQRPAPPAPIIPQPEPEPAPARKQAAGIQPGQLSGQRPIQRKKGLSKEDIKQMRETPQGRAEYKKRMADPSFVAEVNALFAAR